MTTAEYAPSRRPAISLRPAPRCEPPFDDEVEPTVWATAHQLTLSWPAPPEAPDRGGASAADPLRAPDRGALPAGPLEAPGRGALPAGPLEAPGRGALPAGPLEAPGRGAVAAGRLDAPGRGRQSAGPSEAGLSAPAPSPARREPPQTSPARGHRSPVAGASHDAKLAVHRFVRTCVEVLGGHRPPAHLRRLALPTEAAGVVAEGLSAAQRVAALRKAACAPGRRPPRRPAPVAVVRLRLCEPRPGAVEAAVALVTGDRTWALALRMELHHESWHATTLRLL